MSRVVFTQGCIFDDPHFIFHLSNIKKRIAVICDSFIANLYYEKFTQIIEKHSQSPLFIILPEGEENKTRKTKIEIEDELLKNGFGRDSHILAIGGGASTDMAGFIAATYCRGISYSNVATTLIGMIDAAIGGKTGVNTPWGKNLIGAYHMPQEVFVDLSFLSTLDDFQMRQGYAELIKYGLISDVDLFNACKQTNPATIENITKAIAKKNQLTQIDFKESGMRKILNFGHSVAHALESLSNYTIAHGDAVAIGMFIETIISRLYNFPKGQLDTIVKLLLFHNYPIHLIQEYDPREIYGKMRLDKKSVRSNPHICILKRIGEVEPFHGSYTARVSEEQFISSYQEALSYEYLYQSV